jgi:hypothetical protein
MEIVLSKKSSTVFLKYARDRGAGFQPTPENAREYIEKDQG